MSALPSIARLTAVVAAALLAQALTVHAQAPASDAATMSVFATGLDNPRGLRFDEQGLLYVAEGGTGGSDSTIGLCTQVVPPVGPYTGSPTGGRISRIGRWGYRETVTDSLPSSQTSVQSGSAVSGIADVAFVRSRLFGLIAGGGCSHGVLNIPNGVAAVSRTSGRWTLLADLGRFQQRHPTAVENPADFEPDGAWYSMISVDGALYAIEPNHGELDRIELDGRITRIADISATQGHVVPTALTWHDGAFYVGELTPYPLATGASKVLRITLNGDVTVHAEGFTAVTGLAFDAAGRMYVLENTTGNPTPTPGTGDIVRVERRGEPFASEPEALAGTDRQVIASGLMLPTAMIYHEGSLYVSSGGFGLPATGLGQVLQLRLHR